MVKVKWIVCIAILRMSIVDTSWAVEPVTLVAMEFTGAMQADKQGAFDYMLQDLSKQLNLSLDYEVFVPARGLQIFLNQQADCLIPSADYAPYFVSTQVIHSVSFATSRFTAFTLEAPVIKNNADLQAKVVGMIRDNKNWSYESRMAEAKIKFVGVNDLTTLVNMLYLGRIDVAVHERDDFLMQASRLDLAEPKYAKNSPLWTEKIVITCHDTPANQAFLARLNPAISAITQAGKMIEYYQRVLQNNR